MAGTLTGMGGSLKEAAREFEDPIESDQASIVHLVRPPGQGDGLTGPNGLLRQLTRTVLETALDGQMDEYLGY